MTWRNIDMHPTHFLVSNLFSSIEQGSLYCHIPIKQNLILLLETQGLSPFLVRTV